MRYDQEKIATLFVDLEKSLETLYDTCSNYFTHDIDLWTNLSRDEKEHARLAQILLIAAKNSQIRFDDGLMRLYMLNAALDHIAAIKEAVIEEKINGLSTLKMALDLETSLVEKGLFQNYKSNNPNVVKTLKRIERETLLHSEMINKTISAKMALKI
jgi:hypothetical protein